ncbi:hypothetical protein MCEMZLE22_01066 [actinobacterium SCGC AAA044-D11]
MNKLVFMFGAIIGASLGWALPDGNLVVTGFLALSCGSVTLGAWLGIKKIRKILVR